MPASNYTQFAACDRSHGSSYSSEQQQLAKQATQRLTRALCFACFVAATAALQVDQWIETSSQLVSGQQFEALCGRLSDYLSLRSYFVGYGVTAADVAIWGQLQGERLLSLFLGCSQLGLGVALLLLCGLWRTSSRHGHLGEAAG